MLFFIYASFAASEIGNYIIKPVSTLLFFSSFGFTNNSNFNFYIHSSRPIKLNMFLLTNNEIRSSVSRYIYKTCYSPKIKITNLNKTSNISSTDFLWDGNIKNKDIYYPILLICSDNFTELDINYKYHNNESLIDFRNEKNSIFYLIFSSTNFFLGLSWLINTFIKTNFSIPLQQIMAFLPFLKAISNALMASEWETRKYTDDTLKCRKLASTTLSVLFYLLFMYVTTLIFSGWCIFRMNLSFLEKIQILLSSFLCVIGFNINSIVDGYISSLIPILFTSVGFLWYMKLNTTYLATLAQLSESNIENIRMKSRVKLVQHFSVASFTLIIIIILIESGTLSFDFWPIIGICIQEVGVLFLEFTEIYFFFLRDKFIGEADPATKEKMYPILLIDPNEKEIAFISKENKQDGKM